MADGNPCEASIRWMIAKADRRDRDRARRFVQRLLSDASHKHSSEGSAMGGAEDDQLGVLLFGCVLERYGGAGAGNQYWGERN